MSKILYNYNENLIENLSYNYIVDKYSLNKENINKAIYYAVDSLSSHINSMKTNDNKEINILLGDYYSFEYYNLVQDNLPLLASISSCMSLKYQYLQKGFLDKDELFYIVFSLYEILMEEYNFKFDLEDIGRVVQSYEDYFMFDLAFLVDFTFDKNYLLQKARVKYVE